MDLVNFQGIDTVATESPKDSEPISVTPNVFEATENLTVDSQPTQPDALTPEQAEINEIELLKLDLHVAVDLANSRGVELGIANERIRSLEAELSTYAADKDTMRVL